MKILLVGNYPNDRQESMLRFADFMQKGLQNLGHDVRLIQPQAFFGKLKVKSAGLKKWLGYLDKFIVFPRKLRRAADDADVIHICDHSNAMYVSCVQNRPHLVTCHDLLAVRSALGELPENRIGFTGRMLQAWIVRGLRCARFIVADSEMTQNDVIRLCGSNLKKSRVVHLALNYPYTKMAKNKALDRLVRLGVDINAPYVMHVGSDSWYKNREGVIRIFFALQKMQMMKSLNLILVGKPLNENLKDFVQASNYSGKVLELPSVENEDLRALYSQAQALIFPSWYEGFGWPVLEAQACGCPVFASNRPPMTEVGGSGAIYIDPKDIESSAVMIAEALMDTTNLSDRGYQNLRLFSEEKMFTSYVDTYLKLLSMTQ